MKINNQSDFKIKEMTKNEDFNVRFSFEFFVYESKKYVVSWDGKEYVNCKRLDDGSLEIIFNKPKFGLGELKVRREYYISDEDFTDGIWNAVTVEKTGIYITNGETDDIDVENIIVPPYIKGEPGKDMKWSTMTQGEKDELINDLGEGVNNSFVEAENTRNNNEELRKTAESVRVTAEQGRVEAELKRRTDFDTLKSEMQTSIDKGKAATNEAIAATEGLNKVVKVQNAKLSELGSKVDSLDYKRFEVGSVNYETGEEEGNSSMLRTYYIPAKNISYIYGRSINLVFFDSSYNYVGYISDVCFAEEKDFVGYEYVRIVNAYSSNEEDIVVWYKDNTLLDYELGNTGVRLLKDCMLLSLKTMKFQEQQGFYSAIIPCKSGDKINITGKGGASARLYTVIDGAKNIIAQAESAKLVYKENIETSTDGYVILNFSNVYPYKAFFWRKGIVNISSDILSAVEDLSNSKTVISGVFNSWNPNALGNEGQNVNNSGHHIRVDLSRFSPDYVIQGKLRCIVSVYSLVYDKDGNLLRTVQGNNDNDFYYRLQKEDSYIVLSNFSSFFPLENVYLSIEKKKEELTINSLSAWESNALGNEGQNVNNSGHHIRVDLSRFSPDYVIQGKLRCIATVYSLVYDKDGNLLRTIQGRNNNFFYKIQDGDSYIVLSNFSQKFSLEDVSVSIFRQIIGGSKRLKVLCLGNSYTYDAMTYVPYILRRLYPDLNITIGIWYHSGQSLYHHWQNINNGTAVDYEYAESNGVEPWTVEKENISYDNILDKGWDMIVTQQASGDSDKYSSFQPYLNNIIEYTQRNSNHVVKFAWLQTPAYSQLWGETVRENYVMQDMYDGIESAVKEVLSNTMVETVFPVGLAIQNARQTSLNELGDGYKGLFYDSHLQSGLPNKIASYVVALVLLKEVGVNYISIGGDKFVVTSDWLDSIKALQENGPITGETPENNLIAQKCVVQSIKGVKMW